MAAASLRASRPLLVAAAKNGRMIPCDVDATKFLLSLPRGAYTGARTVQQTRVFDYEGHMKRLGASARLDARPLVASSEIVDP
jgi:branched-subunit amino acid aminotransferase/4-amino-4-deoxychorismate lyase